MKLFCGTSNPSLSAKIAEKLALPLSKLEIVRFANSECRVRLEEEDSQDKAVVIQSLSNPADNYLMELSLIADCLKQADFSKITALVPYLGYSRQDRVHREGEAISARVVAKFIQAAGFTRLITVDVHSLVVMGFYQIAVEDVSPLSLFKGVLPYQDFVIVSPDAGGIKRAQRFAHELDVPLVFLEKKRDLGKIHTTEVFRVVGEVKGKSTVIIDDIITSGGTLVKASYLLIQEGAKRVSAFVTHADFMATTPKIIMESPLEALYTTDSISIAKEYHFPKLHIVSIADLLAQVVR